VSSSQARPLHFFECEGSETVRDGVYYGLPVIKFKQQSGFADFLFSFTRRAFVTRDGEALATNEFLDQRTQEVQAVFVFYSPDVGTTSVMQVRTLLRLSGLMEHLAEVRV